MAIVFLTAEEFSDDWRIYLKAKKPDVNIDNTDSNFWTFSLPQGQILSAISADSKAINNDVFIQDARSVAIEKHLITYFNSGFTPATPSQGDVVVTGVEGSVLGAGTQLQYPQNGSTYLTQDSIVIGPSLSENVLVVSTGVGQNQNLVAGTILNIPAPPIGINNSANVGVDGLRDGRNIETPDQAAERLLARIRVPLSGGKVEDYRSFAFEASPAVTGAAVWRYPQGPGTVAVIITSGTTDIDEAIDNDIPITFLPSQELIDEVSEYIETKKPVTDCVTVDGPLTNIIDVTVRVKYTQGIGTTIPAGETLTQEEFVKREVERAIYKTPVGGTQIGGNGFVVASAIEDVLDSSLGNSQYSFGFYVQILSDRFVEDLDGLNRNYQVTINSYAVPGVITVIEL